MTMTIHTEFDSTATASEVLNEVDLTGRTAIVTGGASGIGLETSRALLGAGASVSLAVRNVDAASAAARALATSTGNDDVVVAHLDLADLRSVTAFVSGWERPLDILVNNAGIMAVPELESSPQGHELQFATNFLGHFALAVGLREHLVAAGGARVVSVSSSAHYFSPVVFEDVDFEHRPYDPWSAYGQSKTACILFAVEVTRRWAALGVVANSLNPGAIATGLQKHTGGLSTPVEKRKTPEQGAATSVLLAASPLLDGIGGRYFEDCNESPVIEETQIYGGGVAPYALDQANAVRLWELAAVLTA